MSSAGVTGGPAAPGAGESHARAARGARKGSRWARAPPLAGVCGCGRSGPATGPGRGNFYLLAEPESAALALQGISRCCFPLLLGLQFSYSPRVLSSFLLLELAGHRYELVTFPPNPDVWVLGNERTTRDRGIWKRHPVAQSGRPGRAGELSPDVQAGVNGWTPLLSLA